MFIILFTVVFLMFIIGGICWIKNDYDQDILVFPVTALIGFFILLFAMFGFSGKTTSSEEKIKVDSMYNRINMVIESRVDIDANLLAEIYEYNELIELKQFQLDSLAYAGMIPKIYDDYELIDVSKLKDRLSDADSSVRVVDK